jgi:hypothetical protein
MFVESSPHRPQVETQRVNVRPYCLGTCKTEVTDTDPEALVAATANYDATIALISAHCEDGLRFGTDVLVPVQTPDLLLMEAIDPEFADTRTLLDRLTAGVTLAITAERNRRSGWKHARQTV